MRLRSLFFRSLYLAIFFACWQPQRVIAQELDEAKVSSVEVSQLTADQLADIELLARQLGSNQFSERERAAVRLMDIGPTAVEPLRRVMKLTNDPEVRDRVSSIVRQMTDGATQEKIEQFLTGDPIHFDGWEKFRDYMGDSIPLRELFVEIHLSHPDLLKALDGTVLEISQAMLEVAGRIQHQMFVQRRYPSQADTVALFLPASNEAVPIMAGYESVMISVLDKLEAQRIRNDPRLAPAFRRLLGDWVNRSTRSSRLETLNKSMQWNVVEGLPLAIATLSESTEPETLATAMQTISRFGTKKDALKLRPMLADTRATGESGFGAGQLIQTELRDIAIAAIAVLHDIPLNEMGFAHGDTHPTYGFTFLGIGYSKANQELRAKSLQRVEALLKPSAQSGGS